MESLNIFIWQQFGASLDMLENALNACPEQLWDNGTAFWYMAYHTLFWTDHYLSDNTPMENDFQPPAPFTKGEFIENVMPERTYDKAELLKYLQYVREKLRDQLTRVPADELLTKRFVNECRDYSLFEMLLYNMRHVQHHTAQLNLLLRQGTHEAAPPWVGRTKAVL